MTNVPSHYSISHDNAPNGLLAILEELSDSENVPTPFTSIALFNARKYLLRAPRKNGLEDLVKCRDYLERCIAIYESDLTLVRRQVVGGSVYLCYDYTAASNHQS